MNYGTSCTCQCRLQRRTGSKKAECADRKRTGVRDEKAESQSKTSRGQTDVQETRQEADTQQDERRVHNKAEENERKPSNKHTRQDLHDAATQESETAGTNEGEHMRCRRAKETNVVLGSLATNLDRDVGVGEDVLHHGRKSVEGCEGVVARVECGLEGDVEGERTVVRGEELPQHCGEVQPIDVGESCERDRGRTGIMEGDVDGEVKLGQGRLEDFESPDAVVEGIGEKA